MSTTVNRLMIDFGTLFPTVSILTKLYLTPTLEGDFFGIGMRSLFTVRKSP